MLSDFFLPKMHCTVISQANTQIYLVFWSKMVKTEGNLIIFLPHWTNSLKRSLDQIEMKKLQILSIISVQFLQIFFTLFFIARLLEIITLCKADIRGEECEKNELFFNLGRAFFFIIPWVVNLLLRDNYFS